MFLGVIEVIGGKLLQSIGEGVCVIGGILSGGLSLENLGLGQLSLEAGSN
jgi:hypothetical protein